MKHNLSNDLGAPGRRLKASFPAPPSYLLGPVSGILARRIENRYSLLKWTNDILLTVELRLPAYNFGIGGRGERRGKDGRTGCVVDDE